MTAKPEVLTSYFYRNVCTFPVLGQEQLTELHGYSRRCPTSFDGVAFVSTTIFRSCVSVGAEAWAPLPGRKEGWSRRLVEAFSSSSCSKQDCISLQQPDCNATAPFETSTQRMPKGLTRLLRKLFTLFAISLLFVQHDFSYFLQAAPPRRPWPRTGTFI